MDTTKLTDAQVIAQCVKVLKRNLKTGNRIYLTAVVNHYNQHQMISRVQRQQVDSMLWVLDTRNHKNKWNKV